MASIGHMHAMSQDDSQYEPPKRRQLNLFGKQYKLPESRYARIIVGYLLIVCGVFGFLPVLGFWMIPLGIIVLSQDISFVRRFRRKMDVRFTRWRNERRERRK